MQVLSVGEEGVGPAGCQSVQEEGLGLADADLLLVCAQAV